MMRAPTPAFPLDQLAAVADDIADFFGSEGFASPGQALVVGPPIEAWVAGMEDAESAALSLREAALWTERFHHQVLCEDGRPLGYALTSVMHDDVVIRKISCSEEVPVAIEGGLKMLRARVSDDRALRLLAVPELQIDALWLLDPRSPAGEVLVIRVPPESYLSSLEILSEERFMDVLKNHLPMAGMISGLDEIFCDRPLRELIASGFDDDRPANDAPPIVWEAVSKNEEMVA
jgi:hypothetical protein